MRTEWRSGILAGFLSASALAALSGCPGSIDEDEINVLVGDFDCVQVTEQLFARSCSVSGCHDVVTSAGELDLSLDDFSELVDAPASSDCDGFDLVLPETPTDSLMYQKLLPNPPCGDRMPLLAEPPRQFEVECMELWIQSFSENPPTGEEETTEDP